MKTQDIQIGDYSYELSDERIAKFPKTERDHSKLLIYNKGVVGEDVFYNLPKYLPQGALMVFNNTKVIQARLHFRKANASGERLGALIEIFLLEPYQPAEYEQMFQTTGRCQWLCLVGNQKKWKEGPLVQEFELRGEHLELSATRLGEHGTSQLIEFEWHGASRLSPLASVSFAEVLDTMGELPIPPYLNRETQESDKVTYQTVYSKIKGSVAAPTAGLHFTDRVLSDIDAHGIEREELTLHVGAGTFRPVKSETIGEHAMHSETIIVRRSLLENLLRHLGGDIIPVGTTSTRTLESLYWIGMMLKEQGMESRELHLEQWYPYESHPSLTTREALQHIINYMDLHRLTRLEASTALMIVPGYHMKVVTGLITNFHQPKSTLLLLVSALIGDRWKEAYQYALGNGFRFLSYGDSCIFFEKK